MTPVIRWGLASVVAVHGLLHLLGAAKGLGWSEVSQLTEPIGPGMGILWLVAALLVLVSAVLIAARTPRWWWAVALAAATTSQVAIATSWADAKAGSAANILLALAAAHGFASVGPTSFHAQWTRQSARALAEAVPNPPCVTEEDLVGLPSPLAAYIRDSGAVGKPRVTSFAATFHGRIRGGPSHAWMPFAGRQVNTFGPRVRRLFIMDASRSGVPVTVLHQYADGTATMRVKVLSLVSVVDASGAEMDRGETVTVFNDLVVFAPGAIVDAPVRWTVLDPTHVQGVFTVGAQSVSAVLTFDSDHRLVDFTSQDRPRASSDGKSFTLMPWSTPLSDHRLVGGRLVPMSGQARWEAPQPEGSFTYVELQIDDIDYGTTTVDAPPQDQLAGKGDSRLLGRARAQAGGH